MTPTLVPELIVTDLDASLTFYRDLLGFAIDYERPQERFIYLSGHGATIMLEQPFSRDRLWPKAELVYPFGRGINLEVNVKNVDMLHANVRTADVDVFLPLEEKWYRRKSDDVCVRQFAVHDPDGYLIRLSQEIGSRPVTR
ncbi:MAG: VOC family protein [Hyphomicrobiaceae bacterium]